MESCGVIIRFGLFEFDPRSGELRKQGLKVRLQGQPVEILSMLLARPGELVTREELQKKLWPQDTFVDFDPSLNAAMKRLRSALGDSAETPRFIETLARRGYRFLAPVIPTRPVEVSGCAAAPAPRISPLSVVPAVRRGGGTRCRPRRHAVLPEGRGPGRP
jgi:DNA-binding winged helix-turn-helix (wHTH) protein